ncbi:hypothetical protein SmJEL517_g05577 [Synchytrium microbalum]|uniref:Glycosyltransferase 2-like domain-containing protein n=1 Tax=Synchytrium microbalum TaxID=1806994 RepID=A0A507BKJ4_9FUNG|nr:uncharacterized protein SmJEL517_g05577 [Synchytrium microbalum]TPX30990.1 hypothetical protein SmJEL517_g05577 [Synchytrium microbalum]
MYGNSRAPPPVSPMYQQRPGVPQQQMYQQQQQQMYRPAPMNYAQQPRMPGARPMPPNIPQNYRPPPVARQHAQPPPYMIPPPNQYGMPANPYGMPPRPQQMQRGGYPPMPVPRPPPMQPFYDDVVYAYKNRRDTSYTSSYSDSGSESSATLAEDTPEARAGPAYRGGMGVPRRGYYRDSMTSASDDSEYDNRKEQKRSNVPLKSFALLDDPADKTHGPGKEWHGNTKVVMALLAEMWLINMLVILGGTYGMTFWLPQYYLDDVLWNTGCYWKLAWLLPMPYTLICFFGLTMPFRTPKFLYTRDNLKKRRLDNLYILTVTKGDNREAVYRSWNSHKHLERLHPCIRVHVLTDEPYFFDNINCYTCPKSFTTANSKYKARALEWYRVTMRYTEYDWILHLDEESVTDDETVRRILDFIWYETDYHWGQGVILYNQYKYWTNWIFTVADAIRVGDDLSRFQLQYTYFHRPIFGCHGSFLLTNGLVENAVTWDLGSLTEDYQFSTHAWEKGFMCGKIPGLVREQSPLDLIGFLKQRRRWYVGIRRLPLVLPKIWAFFWTLGILCLYGTLASIPLGIIYNFGTPRWFGFLKDFTFVTFVYLYLLGIFIQDLDRKVNPVLLILRLPITFLIQFIASVMECAAVCYAILFPPADFDVIKK